MDSDRPIKENRAKRRLALLRRSGLFNSSPEGIEIRRATYLEDFLGAYSLVYRTFVREGYINERRVGLRLRIFEALPEMATFIATADGHLAAVMSVVADSPDLGLPSDHCFKPELDELRRQGRKVCEITNLAVDERYRNSTTFPELTRVVFAQALAEGCDDVFIAISPGHARFFEEVLQFDPCGDQRDYGDEKKDLVEGKRMDLRLIRRRFVQTDQQLGTDALLENYFFTASAYHALVRNWTVASAEAFTDVQLLCELFIDRSSLLSRATPEQRAALRQRWGEAIFDQVASHEPGRPALVRPSVSAAQRLVLRKQQLQAISG
jgi:hypothetical protein